MFPQNQPYRVPRSMQWALIVAGAIWMVAADIAAEHAASGFATALHFVAILPFLTEVFFLFLLIGGFTALHWVATRGGSVQQVNRLPLRDTMRREWLLGAAVGWCMLLAAVLPVVLSGNLHADFWYAPRAWGMLLLSVLALAAGALAVEVAFRGYIYRRLTLAIGPTPATVLMVLLFAVVVSLRAGGGGLGFASALAEGFLFSLAYLRTQALWLGWGLRFGWTASMGVLFGLPVRGSADFSSVIDSSTTGAHWMTGGQFGPDGSLIGLVVTLVALPVLYQLTKDYAWEYAYEPIVAGGVAVVVEPPAAHTAMEQAAVAAPAPLVQIASITPAAPSTMPAIEEHLRSRGE